MQDIWMISPKSFKKLNKDKSLEELIIEKNNIILEISQFENDYISGKKKSNIVIDPSPEVRYQMNNEYLKVMIDLIQEKIIK